MQAAQPGPPTGAQASASRWPVLFVSHGAPTLALESNEPKAMGIPGHGDTARRLRAIGRELGQPAAILIASAHWGTAQPMLSGSEAPATVHDFGGFAPELYRVRYPAPGAPAIARRVQQLLAGAGVEAGIDLQHGFDHGVWVPLLHLYPSAEVPVVQLSIQPALDARHHHALGRALAELADENVLVIGSGGITHNLGEAFAQRAVTHEAPWSRAFADWFDARLRDRDTAALLDWRARAPHALRNHPTAEHLMPFFVALGAAGAGASAHLVYRGSVWSALALDAWRFDR
ncbi:MAG: dioxygenase [Proteobacteria bacterium]|nr:dioxygenase [Burkholderiales bacterium]